MTGVHRLQHIQRLSTATLSHNNAVRAHTQAVDDQVAAGAGQRIQVRDQFRESSVPVQAVSVAVGEAWNVIQLGMGPVQFADQGQERDLALAPDSEVNVGVRERVVGTERGMVPADYNCD